MTDATKEISEERILDMTCSCIEFVDRSSDSDQEKTYALLQAVCAIAARRESEGRKDAYSFLEEAYTECVNWSSKLVSHINPIQESFH